MQGLVYHKHTYILTSTSVQKYKMFLKCTTKEIPKRGKTVQNIQSKHIHKYIYGKGSQAKRTPLLLMVPHFLVDPPWGRGLCKGAWHVGRG